MLQRPTSMGQTTARLYCTHMMISSFPFLPYPNSLPPLEVSLKSSPSINHRNLDPFSGSENPPEIPDSARGGVKSSGSGVMADFHLCWLGWDTGYTDVCSVSGVWERGKRKNKYKDIKLVAAAEHLNLGRKKVICLGQSTINLKQLWEAQTIFRDI